LSAGCGPVRRDGDSHSAREGVSAGNGSTVIINPLIIAPTTISIGGSVTDDNWIPVGVIREFEPRYKVSWICTGQGACQWISSSGRFSTSLWEKAISSSGIIWEDNGVGSHGRGDERAGIQWHGDDRETDQTVTL